MSEPAVSVVVTTCRNPEPLERTLRSLIACEPPPDEVVVVENRPGDATTAHVVAGLGGAGVPLTIVDERRRGLSWARNAGLRHAGGDLVAFTDDDVVLDRAWVGALAAGMQRAGDVACVTGQIRALRLDTPAQRVMESFATLDKGAAPRVWRLLEPDPGDPLFPYGAGVFGSGASTMVRASVAREIGGFDPRLGAGTLACAGEDLDLFIRVLRAGFALAYEPGAVLWHDHPADMRHMRREAWSYGVGLTAMLAKHLLDVHETRTMLGLVPKGISHLSNPSSRKNAGKDSGFPRALERLERAGMIVGPWAYLASAARSARQVVAT